MDDRPLHTLQLSMVPGRGRVWSHALECGIGGALGALGALALLAWLLS